MTYIIKNYRPEFLPSKTVKESPDKNIYNARRWRKITKIHKAHHPYCVGCENNGIIKIGRIVDHIISIQSGGSVYDTRNHQTLCDVCHNIKRAKESHGYIGAYEYNSEGEKIPKQNK